MEVYPALTRFRVRLNQHSVIPLRNSVASLSIDVTFAASFLRHRLSSAFASSPLGSSWTKWHAGLAESCQAGSPKTPTEILQITRNAAAATTTLHRDAFE